MSSGIYLQHKDSLKVVAVDVNPLCLIRALPLHGSGNIVLDIGAQRAWR